MSDAPRRTQLLRSPVVIGTVVVIFVAILAWAFFYWFPSNKKLNNLNAQESTLTVQQQALNAKLAQLKATSAAQPQLLALQAELTTLVPPDPGVYPFILTMVNTTQQSGLKLISITAQTSTAAAGPGVTTTPITVTTTGPYDNALTFIKNVEALPRLTIINSVSLTGGGPGSARSTTLSEIFALSIFSAPPVTVPAPPTSSSGTTATTG